MDDFEVHNYNKISFSDERHRPAIERPAGAVVSVTLTAHDESTSWGEFMQREEALALYGWLGLLLSDGEGRATRTEDL